MTSIHPGTRFAYTFMVFTMLWCASFLYIGNVKREYAAGVADSKYFASDARSLAQVAEWRACVDALPKSVDPIVGCPANESVTNWIAARESEYLHFDRPWPLSWVDRHWPQPVWAERLHAAGSAT